ncbi:MAG: aminopeptidase P family N-terminal domain-containing protein, partial [Acidaminococcaceae bacterium]|nr:aminopeptidase P family N-terminal domain-containing protein [Acidaminococcaceae bacterium]
MERIGRIFKFMKQHDLDCIAIKDVCTIRYLTGFTGDSSILYADDRIAVLITDGR